MNYSFLSHGPFTHGSYPVLSRMIRLMGPTLVTVDSCGRLSWNMPYLRLFLVKSGELNDLLSVLCFLLPTMSNRTTQHSDTKIRNDVRTRTLFMENDDMFSTIQYHKMSNQTGFDEYIPAFFPKCLKEVMLEYLCTIRQVEEVFAFVVHGEHAANVYHK